MQARMINTTDQVIEWTGSAAGEETLAGASLWGDGPIHFEGGSTDDILDYLISDVLYNLTMDFCEHSFLVPLRCQSETYQLNIIKPPKKGINLSHFLL